METLCQPNNEVATFFPPVTVLATTHATKKSGEDTSFLLLEINLTLPIKLADKIVVENTKKKNF